MVIVFGRPRRLRIHRFARGELLKAFELLSGKNRMGRGEQGKATTNTQAIPAQHTRHNFSAQNAIWRTSIFRPGQTSGELRGVSFLPGRKMLVRQIAFCAEKLCRVCWAGMACVFVVAFPCSPRPIRFLPLNSSKAFKSSPRANL
jgi:hypothetical protein